MSGSVSPSAFSGQTQAILQGGTNLLQPADPSEMATKYQQLLNARAQNAQIQAQTGLTQQQTANAAQDNNIKGSQFSQEQQAYLARQLGAVVSGDQAGNPQAYAAVINGAANAGIDQGHIQAALQGLQAAGNDPVALKRFGTTMLIGALSGPDVAKYAMGNPITINDGTTLKGGVQMPNGGAISMNGPGVPVNLVSPTDDNTTATVKDSTGAEITDTKAGLKARGLMSSTGVPTNGWGQSGPPASGPAGSGTIPNGGYGSTGPSVPTTPSPGVSSNKGPGTVEAAKNTAQAKTPEGEAQIYGQLRDAVIPTNQSIQSLTEGYNFLKGLTSGQSLDYFTQHRAAINNWLSALGFDTSKTNLGSGADQFDYTTKLLRQAMLQQPSAGNNVTSLNLTEKAFPNTDQMTNGAALMAIPHIIGQMRQKLLPYMQQQATSPGNPNGISKFTDAAGELNSDGLATDFMTPQQVTEQLKKLHFNPNLGPNEQDKQPEAAKEFMRAMQFQKQFYRRGISDSLWPENQSQPVPATGTVPPPAPPPPGSISQSGPAVLNPGFTGGRD